MRSVSTGTIYYYEEDMLGSSRTLVQAGQTSVCYDADFYPFGGERDVTSTCSQNYKFEGKERDTETNNDAFGARYYSSQYGRWLSADWSSVPAPVPYANLTNPQTLNLYAMVSDNPESFADLDGHGPTWAVGAGNDGSGNDGITGLQGGCVSSALCEMAAQAAAEETQLEAQSVAEAQAQQTAKQQSKAQKPKPKRNPGVRVVLPNGSNVVDPNSPTGKMMSPVANLGNVAAAGRLTGQIYRDLLAQGDDNAFMFLIGGLGGAVGTGGSFDYQRSGNPITGFTQLPQFRDVSNFNVGLFSQQAGLTLDETLRTAGTYGRVMSSNASPGRPYGLDPQTARFITQGYQAGASGMFQ